MALIAHWVTTETGPARLVITWQARILEGQHYSRLTTIIFLVPALLLAWLVSRGCRRVLTRLGAYDRPSANAGFNHHNGSM
ncbi:MAG: hypothetical protein ACFB2W_23820 [Leptolyngbyaceae cyanobacterium]